MCHLRYGFGCKKFAHLHCAPSSRRRPGSSFAKRKTCVIWHYYTGLLTGLFKLPRLFRYAHNPPLLWERRGRCKNELSCHNCTLYFENWTLKRPPLHFVALPSEGGELRGDFFYNTINISGWDDKYSMPSSNARRYSKNRFLFASSRLFIAGNFTVNGFTCLPSLIIS